MMMVVLQLQLLLTATTATADTTKTTTTVVTTTQLPGTIYLSSSSALSTFASASDLKQYEPLCVSDYVYLQTRQQRQQQP